MVKGVLLDIAGVLEQDGAAVPGSLEAVAQIKARGYRLRLITNTSRRCRRVLCQDLRRLGYVVNESDVFTAPMAIRRHLEQQQLEPLLLIDPALTEDFAGLTGSRGVAVVLCDAADGFTYAALNQAFQALLQGAELLAVGDNRYYRANAQFMLDAGPFVRALEYAADCKAEILGKPAAGFFHAAAADMGCQPGQILMVGDDVNADVLGALEAGLQACMVRTGKYRPGDEQQLLDAPAMVHDDLAQLAENLP
jgi:HAD superfamily hydrolase (TIGR01458 family)